MKAVLQSEYDAPSDVLSVHEFSRPERAQLLVVEATFPLEAVLDALGHFEAGHGRGKVVLHMPAEENP